MLLPLLLLLAAPTTVDCVGTGRCAVTVEVNGARLLLLVDTGADTVLLNKQGMRKAGLRLDDRAALVPIRGVTGSSLGVLSFAKVKVGDREESGVRLIGAPASASGDNDGLLGMSFLGRFRVSMPGKSLEIVPLDEGEEARAGGRGRSWWQARYAGTQVASAGYEAALSSAKKYDEQVAREIGTAPGELEVADLLRRLRKVIEDERRALDTAAANAAVPHEWRR